MSRCIFPLYHPAPLEPDLQLPAPFRTFQMNRMHDLARFSAGLDPKLRRVVGSGPSKSTTDEYHRKQGIRPKDSRLSSSRQ